MDNLNKNRNSITPMDYRTPMGSSSSSSTNVSNNSTPMHSTSSKLLRNSKRSKSLSSIHPEAYTHGEICRIRERLLRTNSHIEPSELKKFTRRQRMTLASLALVDLVGFCAMSIIAPFFPREAAEKGMSDTMSGFVFSFYALVMFISSPIFGKILPRIGAKFLFISGVFLAGICNLLFGFLEFIDDYTIFTTFCLIIRGLEALGASAFSTASYVFVINTFPNSISSVLGILETFVGLGMSTGPAIGGILYSLGGFNLPFFTLGIVMIVITPINIFLLPSIHECRSETKNKLSMFSLLKIPAILVTGFIIIVTSSTWSFLDPTLEPHLRQFNLTPEKIGLIFLLFSALYGISSPVWGILADKCNNHWSLMIVGLFACTIGLLLLGPSPYLPFLNNSLWLNLVALSILGVSVALTLLPTFQSVLSSAVNDRFPDTIVTYSMVAGIWSCLFSLGHVIGPTLGGFFLEYYGFPFTSTVMALATLTLAVSGLVFFLVHPNKTENDGESTEDFTESWKSGLSTEPNESTPLLYSMVENDQKMYASNPNIHQEDYVNNTDLLSKILITPKGANEI